MTDDWFIDSSLSKKGNFVDAEAVREKEGESPTEVEQLTVPPPTEVAKGAYHELHPGQYHEVNPGQYSEVNPGQYHEVNPGQYHEVNPGQYHEVNPGQPTDEPNLHPPVKVDVVKSTDEAKVYNVQSRVDEFIIGEYGTISTANGQTQHGVRYTAVADDNSGVDQRLIYEALLKYFPKSVKGVDPPPPQRSPSALPESSAAPAQQPLTS